MTFDDLVVICASFYALDEIKKALVIMAKYSRQRMPSHKGPEKEKARKSVIDILKLLLDPRYRCPHLKRWTSRDYHRLEQSMLMSLLCCRS